MESLRQYVISIICAALICSILIGIVPKGTSKELLRMLCGLFLTLTVIQPISRIELDTIFQFYTSFADEAKDAASAGEEMAADAIADSIKGQLETYILNKAEVMNTQISVNVTIGEDYLPISAKLSGKISPYTRRQLETILESDLGITKENQLWTG